MKMNRLTTLIMIAMVLGVIVGYACNTMAGGPAAAKEIAGYFGILTDIFLRLIKMIIAPLVFGTLLASIIAMVVATPVAVGIALFEDQRAVVDILAPDVEVQDRERKTGSVLHHIFGKAGRHTFSPRLTVQVDSGHANGPHVGVLSEIIFHRHVVMRSGHGSRARSRRTNRLDRPMRRFGPCPWPFP